MKKWFWLSALSVIVSTAWAANLDSLTQELELSIDPVEQLDILRLLVLNTEDGSDLKLYFKFRSQLEEKAILHDDAYSLAFTYESYAIYHYGQNALDSAAFYFRKAADTYGGIGKKIASYDNLCKVGVMNCDIGNFTEAKEIFKIVIDSTTHDSLIYQHARAHNNMGALFYQQSLIDSAESYFIKSKFFFEQVSQPTAVTPPMNNLAEIYAKRGDYDDAIDMAKRVLQIRLDHGNSYDHLTSYSAISQIYKDSYDLNQALDYGLKGYELAEKITNRNLKGDVLNNIAQIYLLNTDYASALRFINEAIETNGDERLLGIYEFSNTKAEIQIQMNDMSGAIHTIENAIQITSENSDQSNLTDGLYLTLADVHYINGEYSNAEVAIQRFKNKTPTAKSDQDKLNFLKAKLSFNKLDYKTTISHGLKSIENYEYQREYDSASALAKILSRSYEALGQFKESLKYGRKYEAFTDSLNIADNIRLLTQKTKDFEFELEKKNIAVQQAKEEALLKTQNERSKIIAVAVGLIAAISLISLFYVRKKNRSISKQKLQLENLNSIKDQIFAIIGHDLRKPAIAFNGLSKKVSYLLQKRDFEGLNKLGAQIEFNGYGLQKNIDNLLNWALTQKSVVPYDPEIVSLKELSDDLIGTVSSRLDSKNISFTNKMRADQEVWSDKNALYTVLLNLIDNAIKFTHDGGEIILTAEDTQNQLKITVKDSGKGMSQDTMQNLFLLSKDKSKKGTHGERGTGLGLHIALELVKLNKGIINVSSQIGKGSTFDIILPSVA